MLKYKIPQIVTLTPNKVYLKGISIKGFVGEMDFTPIRKCRKSALSELETLLNVNID